MEALQAFYYATVGLLALLFIIRYAKASLRDVALRWKRRKARELRERFHDAFESVQPTVELWWEDSGRKEIRPTNDNPLLEVLPEHLRKFAETQQQEELKQVATQLAGGLVLKSKAKLSPSELTVIDKEIEDWRQQLLDNGIDTDKFEKLFA